MKEKIRKFKEEKLGGRLKEFVETVQTEESAQDTSEPMDTS